jgi:transcription elongation factor GreA
MDATIPVTAEGLDRLIQHLDHLTGTRREEITERLRQAFESGGEPPENGDLVDAMREQELLERQIVLLRARLARARLIDVSEVSDGVVGIGTRVRLQIADSKDPIHYDIVGTLEADLGAGKLSDESPVGRAVIGHRSGEMIQVAAPGGTFAIRILSVGPIDGDVEG